MIGYLLAISLFINFVLVVYVIALLKEVELAHEETKAWIELSDRRRKQVRKLRKNQ